MNGQAICKDCGNGTLDNLNNEQFILVDDGYSIACKNCGSTHVDGELTEDFGPDEELLPISEDDDAEITFEELGAL